MSHFRSGRDLEINSLLHTSWSLKQRYETSCPTPTLSVLLFPELKITIVVFARKVVGCR